MSTHPELPLPDFTNWLRCGNHHAASSRSTQRVRRRDGRRAGRRLPSLRPRRRGARRRAHRHPAGVLLRRRSGPGGETFGAPGPPRSAPPACHAALGVRKPVIAAVNGHAIGLGFTLALQCDLRIFAADAKYGVVQVRRGVMGDAYAHWTLPRIVGWPRGRDPAHRAHVRRSRGAAGPGQPCAPQRRGARRRTRRRARHRRQHRADVGRVQQAGAVGKFDLDRDEVNHLRPCCTTT